MNEFNETKFNINKDIDQVFQKVCREFEQNYTSIVDISNNISDHNLEHLRSQIKKDIPSKIKYKKILILDTVLNYLTEDARQILEGSENKIINDFYDQNQYWIEKIKNNFEHSRLENSLSLSPDSSLIYGISSWAATVFIGVIIGSFMLKRRFFILLISVMIGYAVADITYKKTIPIATQKIDEDVKRYIQQSQAQTKQELDQIINAYINYFKNFLEERNLVKSEVGYYVIQAKG